MRTTRKQTVAITSQNDLLASFLVDLPPDYRHQPTRLHVHSLAYFLPYLRIPTPLNAAPYSYLILQEQGNGVVQINSERVVIDSCAAMFVHRGSVVSLRSLDPSTTGWIVLYDDAVIRRLLPPQSSEQVFGLRSPISLSVETMEWIGKLCELMQQQIIIESGDHQPVSEHLLGALAERLLAESEGSGARSPGRPESLDRQFRRLVFQHGLTEGSVGFYAGQLNVSENYLLRCIRMVSGRSPKEWILDVRLMQAQKLLQTTDESIGEIAARVGFDDPSYFARLFRKRFGMTPQVFRTMSRQDLSD